MNDADKAVLILKGHCKECWSSPDEQHKDGCPHKFITYKINVPRQAYRLYRALEAQRILSGTNDKG